MFSTSGRRSSWLLITQGMSTCHSLAWMRAKMSSMQWEYFDTNTAMRGRSSE